MLYVPFLSDLKQNNANYDGCSSPLNQVKMLWRTKSTSVLSKRRKGPGVLSSACNSMSKCLI